MVRLPKFLVPLLIGLLAGYLISKFAMKEGFQAMNSQACNVCGNDSCPPMPDMTKYVLKASVPPKTTCPDMSQYMLKTECPPVPDLSQYVLKSSIPTPEPIIVDNSSCKNSNCGDCPPCPRPRCPDVKCPEPTVCPACPPCKREACPTTKVKCKAEETPVQPVRPFLAPLNFGTFGE
jgi:hypothetical protein|uniref:Uncharacterized protein n=1 Tax=viral metagenome TaxID=1070528 RepID=A0A6C0DCS0_9ZZZZ